MALTQKGDETITVSGTAIGFSSGEYPDSSNTNGNVQEALVYVESGGPIRWNAFATPTGGGSEGSPLKYASDTPLRVIGVTDIQGFKMIKDTGVSDATIRVAFFGSGS